MFAELLARIGGALDAAAVPYMVIGGQAVLVHGEPRLTRDIDVTLGAGLERLDELVDLAGRIGLRPLVDPDRFTRETLVLPCEDAASGIRVDFVLSLTPYEREAIDRAAVLDLAGAPVRFATAEDLVVHKMLAGRPRDLEDVRGVLRRQPALDLVRVRAVLDGIGAAVEEPLTERFDALARDVASGR